MEYCFLCWNVQYWILFVVYYKCSIFFELWMCNIVCLMTSKCGCYSIINEILIKKNRNHIWFLKTNRVQRVTYTVCINWQPCMVSKYHTWFFCRNCNTLVIRHIYYDNIYIWISIFNVFFWKSDMVSLQNH